MVHLIGVDGLGPPYFFKILDLIYAQISKRNKIGIDLSKSFSNIFEELEKRNEENKNFRYKIFQNQ